MHDFINSLNIYYWLLHDYQISSLIDDGFFDYYFHLAIFISLIHWMPFHWYLLIFFLLILRRLIYLYHFIYYATRLSLASHYFITFRRYWLDFISLYYWFSIAFIHYYIIYALLMPLHYLIIYHIFRFHCLAIDIFIIDITIHWHISHWYIDTSPIFDVDYFITIGFHICCFAI